MEILEGKSRFDKIRMDDFIERRIVTGLIVSTDYIRAVNNFWNISFLESTSAKLLSVWCLEYFETYNKSPGKDIEGIFLDKSKGLSRDKIDDIKEILSGLSKEYERGQFNVNYLLDQTRVYFREQGVKKLIRDINSYLSSGNLVESEKAINEYSPPVISGEFQSINPFTNVLAVKRAFEDAQKPLIQFPINKPDMKTLGEFWNGQLVREGLVALLGPEKRGKTFMLLELGMRAKASGCNVAFFQAGDMSENQMVKRLCIYLSRKSNVPKHCEGLWLPEVDCVYNQDNTCIRKEREKNEGALLDEDIPEKWNNYEKLINVCKENTDHIPCRNCKKMKGTVWLKKGHSVKPLTWKEAYKNAKSWQKKHNKSFKLSTYPNNTLTVSEIRTLLNIWEKQEEFIPDVVIIDYADILAPESKQEFRHQQNKIWQELRRLSQEKHCLVITATQAAASSYGKRSLELSDFSEDKRKYSHVTAMYGLNQDEDEKKIGIMRINALVIREDEFSITNQVTILQRLQIGRPFLGSYK